MGRSIKEDIMKICKNDYKYFFNNPSVVGIAMGYKSANGIESEELSLKILVKEKTKESHIKKEHIIPKEYKGVMTDVEEVGEVYSLNLNSRERPIVGGNGIGVYNLEERIGTLGCIVSKGNGLNTKFYILSNNHVIARENKNPLGTKIIQPSIKHGGGEEDVIATLSDYIHIDFFNEEGLGENVVDCALGEVKSIKDISPEISWSGYIEGLTNPSLGMAVKKSGCVTGQTLGVVTMTNATIKVKFPSGEAVFMNQVITNAMARHGDSGSLLLSKVSNRAVGLLFAGNNLISVHNNILDVVNALDVDIVTL